MVGARGFEPPASWSRTRRSTRLSHAPTNCEPLYLNPQLPHSATFYRATRVTRVTRYNSQVPRFFTFDQASRILPAVELLIRDALFLKVEYQQATNAIDAFSRKIANMGGTRVNHAEILALRDKKSSSGRRLQQTMAKIEDTGCIVKDLDIGLLDFPTLLDGQQVHLCWRLGETKIEFWHGIHEGFQGRKLIDPAFLAKHSGGDSFEN